MVWTSMVYGMDACFISYRRLWYGIDACNIWYGRPLYDMNMGNKERNTDNLCGPPTIARHYITVLDQSEVMLLMDRAMDIELA